MTRLEEWERHVLRWMYWRSPLTYEVPGEARADVKSLITAAREEGAREERERLAPFVQAVLDSFQKPLGNMTGPMNALEKAIRAGEGSEPEPSEHG